MKTLLILLAFMGMTFAQSEMFLTTSGNLEFANDSLYYVFIDTSATPDDTLAAVVSKFIAPQGRYDWMTYTVRDTGTSIDDTVIVKYQQPGMTAWYPVEFMRDSTWTNVTQPVVDDNSQHSYTVFIKPYYKVGFFLTNTATLDTGHVSYIHITVSNEE